MQYRLSDLIIVVVVLGNALGLLVSGVADDYFHDGLWMSYNLFGLLIVIDILGGAWWAIRMATILNFNDLRRRLGLMVLGWMMLPGIFAALAGFALIIAGIKFSNWLYGFSGIALIGVYISLIYMVRRIVIRAKRKILMDKGILVHSSDLPPK